MERSTLEYIKIRGCFNKNIYRGRAMPLNIDAKETILLMAKTTNHVRITRANTTFMPAALTANPNNTPRVVAMPFPPLNLKNIVQLWPQIQQKPKRRRAVISEIPVILAAMILPKKNTTANPFKISKTNTAIPAGLPNTLNALAAPTLPEPDLRISIPFKRRPNI